MVTNACNQIKALSISMRQLSSRSAPATSRFHLNLKSLSGQEQEYTYEKEGCDGKQEETEKHSKLEASTVNPVL